MKKKIRGRLRDVLLISGIVLLLIIGIILNQYLLDKRAEGRSEALEFYDAFQEAYDQEETIVKDLSENSAFGDIAPVLNDQTIKDCMPEGVSAMAVYTNQGKVVAKTGDNPDSLRDTVIYKKIMAHLDTFTQIEAVNGEPALVSLIKVGPKDQLSKAIVRIVYPLTSLNGQAQKDLKEGHTVYLLSNTKEYYDYKTRKMESEPGTGALAEVLNNAFKGTGGSSGEIKVLVNEKTVYGGFKVNERGLGVYVGKE